MKTVISKSSSGGGLLPGRRGERKRHQRREKMIGGAGGRRYLVLSLALLMVIGIAVYFRLWLIDYRISVDESALIRRQFDLAHREAMDESAEWRLKFDEERERSTKCMDELTEIKDSLGKKSENDLDVSRKLEMLQKENAGLMERLEALKQELETENSKCKSR